MNAVIQQKSAMPHKMNDGLGITHTHLNCEKRVSAPVVECDITPQTLIEHGPPCTSGRAIVFADSEVWQRLEPWLGGAFNAAYADVQVVRLPGGEACKSLDSLHHVLAQMAAMQIVRRGDALFALGGGSVLDVVGFAASIFRRGVRLTKIPTSLLAQVDAAISLKNAINIGKGKNLVGSFAPPHSVLVDFRFLDTLALRHRSNGMAEIIKLGLMVDAPLINALAIASKRPMESRSTMYTIFRQAITGMACQLNRDPYEQLLQRAVDFGHWLSPQLEMADNTLLHGEAVAIDMAISLTVSLHRGHMSPKAWTFALGLLSSWNLPLSHDALDSALVKDSLKRTLQHRGGVQNIPMCMGIGSHEFFDDLRSDEVLQAHTRLVNNPPTIAGSMSVGMTPVATR